MKYREQKFSHKEETTITITEVDDTEKLLSTSKNSVLGFAKKIKRFLKSHLKDNENIVNEDDIFE